MRRTYSQNHNTSLVGMTGVGTDGAMMFAPIELNEDMRVARIHIVCQAAESTPSWKCAIYRLNERWVNTDDPVFDIGVHPTAIRPDNLQFRPTATLVKAANHHYKMLTTAAPERVIFHFTPKVFLRASNVQYMLALGCDSKASSGVFGSTYHWSGAGWIDALTNFDDPWPEYVELMNDTSLGSPGFTLFSPKGLTALPT